MLLHCSIFGKIFQPYANALCRIVITAQKSKNILTFDGIVTYINNMKNSCISHVHFVGIGGIGVSALAQHLLQSGVKVSGSDLVKNDRTVALQQQGATVFVGHNIQNISGASLVVRSSAVSESNCEIAASNKRNVPVILREQLLGTIFDGFSEKIAVCGTHGKTTVTALLDHIFSFCEKSHVSFLGGVSGGNNYKSSGGNTVIAEACEYRESFLNLHPNVCTCLNVEYDHPDYYKSFEKTENAFSRFFDNLTDNGILVVNTSVNKKLYAKCSNVLTFGEGGQFLAQNVKLAKDGSVGFVLVINGKVICHVQTKLSGTFNVNNVLGAVATAVACGLPVLKVVQAVTTFVSATRRYTFLPCSGFTLVEDYAHHPTQVQAVVQTARATCKGKLIVVFQPHTFSRTKAFWKKFCTCFDGADQVFLLPIYPAREQPLANVTSYRLCNAMQQYGINATYCKTFVCATRILKNTAKQQDLVLILGAGDVHLLAQTLSENC